MNRKLKRQEKHRMKRQAKIKHLKKAKWQGHRSTKNLKRWAKGKRRSWND